MLRTALLCCLVGIALAAEPVTVVASDSLIGDLVRQAGADRVQVHCLVGAGADPHHFDPGPRAVADLGQARLLVVHSCESEPWVDRLVKASAYVGPVVETAATIVDPLRDAHGAIDTHAWHDARAAARMVAAIAEALTAIDPEGTTAYAQAAATADAALRRLDAEIRRDLADLPASRRILVTPHHSLAYFARAYGLDLHSLVACEAHAEPDPRVVLALTRLVADRALPAVFADGKGQDRLMTAIADGRARVAGPLQVDQLGSHASLDDLLRSNATIIREALSAP